MLSKSDGYRLVREEYKLPSTKTKIANLIREIMGGGAVEKIIIEVDNPVLVFRMVPLGDCEELAEELDGVIRQSEFEEYENPDGSAAEILCDMMHLAGRRRLRPICWVAGNDETGLMDKWLGLEERGMPVLESDNEGILGLPVIRISTLPEETLILCASPYVESDPVDTSFVVKTVMEIREIDDGNEEENEDNDRVRDNPGGPGSSDGELEAVTRGGLGTNWIPKGVPRSWLGGG